MFPLSVPYARPRPIDNATLATLAEAGHDVARGICDPARAEWLGSCVGPLLDELIQRRAAMANQPVSVDLGNVVALPVVR